MTATLTTIVVAALGSVGAYFTWRTSKCRQRKDAAKAVASEDAAHAATRAEIEEAVYNRDDAKLNEIVHKLMED